MANGALPYFKFYVKDWLSDFHVRAMTPAERGIYADLLAFDWSEGGIPDDPDRLARALHIDADAMRDAWGALADRFKAHPEKDGYVTNRRLSRERREIRDAKEKRSEAARKAANARWEQERKHEKSDGNADAMRSARDTRSREKQKQIQKQIQRENNTADAGVENLKFGNWTTEYVPIVRQALWLGSEPPPNAPDGWNLSAELSTIKKWRERRDSHEVRAFLLGAAILRDRGELGGVKPHEGITSARLRWDSPYEVVSPWEKFPHAWYKFEGWRVGDYEIESRATEGSDDGLTRVSATGT